MADKRKPIEVIIWMVGGVVAVGILMALVSVTGSQYVKTQASLEEMLEWEIEELELDCEYGWLDCLDQADSNFDACIPADHPSEGFCDGVFEYDKDSCHVQTVLCYTDIADFMESLDLSDDEDDNLVDTTPTPEPTV